MRTLAIGTMLLIGGCATTKTTSARDAALLARLDSIDARAHAVEAKLDRLANATRAPSTTTDRIDVAVGGQKVLAADRVAHYVVGAQDIVHVKVTSDGNHMVLLGMKPGYAGLLLVYADGTTRSYDVHVDSEPHDSGATRIDLVVGGLRVIPIAGVTNFATGNDVVQVKTFDDGQKLVLDAVKPGYTGLTLIYADGRVDNYDVRVTPSAQ